MAELINLRQHRKRRKRSEKAAKAQENRTAHGQTKTQQLQAQQASTKSKRELDGKKLAPKS